MITGTGVKQRFCLPKTDGCGYRGKPISAPLPRLIIIQEKNWTHRENFHSWARTYQNLSSPQKRATTNGSSQVSYWPVSAECQHRPGLKPQIFADPCCSNLFVKTISSGQSLSSVVRSTQSRYHGNLTGDNQLGPSGNAEDQRTHGLHLLRYGVGQIPD